MAALAPPSLVLSLAALIGGPGVAFGFAWLLIAGFVGAVAVLAVWRFRRVKREENTMNAPVSSDSDW